MTAILGKGVVRLMSALSAGCVKTQNTTDKRTVCNTQSVK
jgi:hypothetical protein